MEYTDENAGWRPILRGGGKGGVGRLEFVFCVYVVGIGTVRGGEGEFHMCVLLAEEGCGVFRKQGVVGARQEAGGGQGGGEVCGSKGDEGRRGPF